MTMNVWSETLSLSEKSTQKEPNPILRDEFRNKIREFGLNFLTQIPRTHPRPERK